MNSTNVQHHKDMYVINLDMVRIFWIIAIGLFMLTFFFLFGYWLGNDTKSSMQAISKPIQNKSNQKKWISYDQKELKEFLELQKVQKVTENALLNPSKPSKKKVSYEPNLQTQKKNAIKKQKVIHLKKVRTQKSKASLSKSNRSKSKMKSVLNVDPRLSQKKPYAVQVSINRVRENANRLYNDLKDRGLPSYVYKKASAGVVLNVVRVGPFSSYYQALGVQKRLKSLSQDSIIIQH